MNKLKLIARMILWSIVGLLMLFLAFMSGGALMLYDIEQQCVNGSVFQTQDNMLWQCKKVKIKIIPKNEWKQI